MTDKTDKTDDGEFVVKPSYIDGVFADLIKMQVDLDNDPLTGGIKRLQDKNAQLRAMLSRVEKVFLQVSYDIQRFTRQHRVESTCLDLAVNHLLGTDIEVRSAPSVREREALARNKLKDDAQKVEVLASGIADLNFLLVAIKAKRADLKDTSGRLRDQIRMCKDEIEVMNLRWGSRKPGADPLKPNASAFSNEDEVNHILRGIGLADDPDEGIVPTATIPAATPLVEMAAAFQKALREGPTDEDWDEDVDGDVGLATDPQVRIVVQSPIPVVDAPVVVPVPEPILAPVPEPVPAPLQEQVVVHAVAVVLPAKASEADIEDFFAASEEEGDDGADLVGLPDDEMDLDDILGLM